VADKRRVAWDTTVIIDALEGEALEARADGNAPSAPWWPEIKPIYNNAEQGNLEIVVSEVSVAEACKITSVQAEGVSIEDAESMVQEFFDNEFIIRVPADCLESELAARFIRDHKLETCDAIIAATALIHEADTLYSRDGKKKRRAKQTTLLRNDGQLQHPDYSAGQPLSIKPPNAAGHEGATLYETDQNE
jgi:predicted nucleic acid-binding protein